MRFEGGDLYAFTTFGYTMTAGLVLIWGGNLGRMITIAHVARMAFIGLLFCYGSSVGIGQVESLYNLVILGTHAAWAEGRRGGFPRRYM